ncbi:hypothetical protein FD19_GL000062 [Lacticaseibacillus thailandensis DSM 22698 = JCM 13996]|uniref:Uncharacterized protein n=2 Tax=Lacticaseibacillus thailandensis TaxID=381741 RepID=A0A0R2CHA0_9LACO|nr:hypothetical protein FD19_GL000062 [Lacticaseibacillus thailandensis DSM 22698 = JCM 13996]
MVHRLRQCIADLLNARDQNIFLANQVVATNMFKVMLNYYVLGRTFVKAADFGDTQEQMQHYQPLMTAIHQCITTIPKDAPEHIFTRLVDDIELALFTTLTPVLPLFKTIEPLNIRLELEGESFLNKDIVGFLNSFAVINVLPQDSSVAPDVILCSIDNYDKVYNLLHLGAGKLDPEPTIIHWSNQSEDTTLLNLLGRINELANAKAARLAHRTDE